MQRRATVTHKWRKRDPQDALTMSFYGKCWEGPQVGRAAAMRDVTRTRGDQADSPSAAISGTATHDGRRCTL